MKKTSKTHPAAWLAIVGILIVGSGLFMQQHIRKAEAATTNYPATASATFTPDTLLW
jgi:hypothetical protein